MLSSSVGIFSLELLRLVNLFETVAVIVEGGSTFPALPASQAGLVDGHRQMPAMFNTKKPSMMPTNIPHFNKCHY